MAPLARRTWAQMATEVTLRLGNPTTTGFDARIQYALVASYDDLCTTFHHVELDNIDTSKVCSTSTNTVTLPADCLVVVGVRLKAVGGAVLGQVLVEDYRLGSALYVATSGQPTRCSRFQNSLYFNTKPDQAYPLEIFYYRRCTVPDFSASASSELDRDVDEHIIEGAIRRLFPAISRADLGDVQRTLMSEWMGAQFRSSILDPLTAAPEKEFSATTYTKGQG